MKYWENTNNLSESGHTYENKIKTGFFEKYLSGNLILDIGYKGGKKDALPILPHATGVDFDFPGYDGKRLPFQNETVDSIYSSHCLEHIADYTNTLLEWIRVLKPNGYIIIVVPHMHLYERRLYPPSIWSGGDHKRYYTPSRLLREIEESINPIRYRLCHMQENRNLEFNYLENMNEHSKGPYEIEVVIQKLF